MRKMTKLSSKLEFYQKSLKKNLEKLRTEEDYLDVYSFHFVKNVFARATGF